MTRARKRAALSRVAVDRAVMRLRLQRVRLWTKAPESADRLPSTLRGGTRLRRESVIELHPSIHQQRRNPGGLEHMPQTTTGLFRRRQGIAYGSLLLLQLGLLQRTIQRAGRNVNAWLSRNGHSTFLRPMMELAVTSLHSNLKPPIGLKEFDEFSDLHAR